MRISLPLGVLMLALSITSISAQTKKEKPANMPSRARLADLQMLVKSEGFTNKMKFAKVLELASGWLQNVDPNATITVDEEAYRDAERQQEAVDIYNAEIHLRNLPAKTPLMSVLRQAVKQLPITSAILVRGGKVEIVPIAHTSKKYLLNQTFHIEFNERRLDTALEELSDLTGVSIVIDPRARQKVQTPVTARFYDDVALQDAVRMLADMAELKIVYLVTGLYITTPEHAQVMQKELKQIYEGPAPPMGVGVPVDPMIGVPNPPTESPLAPPLPPSRGVKQAEGA